MRLTPFLLVAVFAGGCAACTGDCDPGENQCPIDARIDASSCDTPGPNLACPAETPVCGSDRVCIGCVQNADCAGRDATPVCFGEPSGECVACDEDDHQSLAVGTADDNCPTSGMQVCDSESHACRACRADSECTSGVCNELNGECANNVLHVDSDPANTPSDSNDCLTPATPCLTVTGAMAKTVSGTRYIAVHAADVEYLSAGEIAVTGSASVYVKGIPDPAQPDYVATLDRSGTGPILSVDGSSASLTIVGVTLSGASGTDGDGVECSNVARLTVLETILSNNAHYGINAAGCNLIIDRSTIRENTRGGGHVDGEFSITNTFIHGNVGTSSFGGLEIDLDPSDVFAHNTIFRNTANTGVPGGLRCIGTGTARHNIIYGSLGTIVEYNPVGGCSHEYSLIGTTAATGTGNITAGTVDEIHFANIATLPHDLHLTAGSIAIDKGGPNDGAGRTISDFDGDPRPVNMADLGADEVP